MKKVFTYILKLSARFLLFLFEMVLFNSIMPEAFAGV